MEGQIEVVKYLLEKGVNPKCKDRWGNTPLSEIKHKCIDSTNQNSVYHQIQNLLEKSIDALSRSSSVSSSPKIMGLESEHLLSDNNGTMI